MIKNSLQKDEFMVESASDYDTAMSKVGVYDYDLVILDINLPGGNGLSILKKIKLLEKSEGILIVSARNSLTDKIEGLDLGADDYLTKPFHMAELMSRVNSILRRRNLEGNKSISFKNMEIFPESRTATIGALR